MAASIVAMAVVRADNAPVVGNLGDDYFSAGGVVSLDDVVTGDAFLAGGEVQSNASIGGDAVVAGGRIAVRATVGDDLYAAGGDVEVDALVGGDARIASGRVQIAPESRIEGGMTLAAGEVMLGGHIRGDVHVYARELTVLHGTRIDGRLLYRVAGSVAIPPDVRIGGGLEESHEAAPWDQDASPSAEERSGRVRWFGVAALGILGLLIVRLFPGFSARATAVLSRSPLRSLGVGMLLMVGVPAAAAALFVTVIGIPAALVVLLLYAFALVLAYVLGAQFVGDSLLASLRPEAAIRPAWRIGALLLALLALTLAAAVPIVGGLVRFAVLLLGLGAIVQARRPAPLP